MPQTTGRGGGRPGARAVADAGHPRGAQGRGGARERQAVEPAQGEHGLMYSRGAPVYLDTLTACAGGGAQGQPAPRPAHRAGHLRSAGCLPRVHSEQAGLLRPATKMTQCNNAASSRASQCITPSSRAGKPYHCLLHKSFLCCLHACACSLHRRGRTCGAPCGDGLDFHSQGNTSITR